MGVDTRVAGRNQRTWRRPLLHAVLAAVVPPERRHEIL